MIRTSVLKELRNVTVGYLRCCCNFKKAWVQRFWSRKKRINLWIKATKVRIMQINRVLSTWITVWVYLKISDLNINICRSGSEASGSQIRGKNEQEKKQTLRKISYFLSRILKNILMKSLTKQFLRQRQSNATSNVKQLAKGFKKQPITSLNYKM